MAKELTVFKSKDIDNIDVHAKGCVNNAPHSKVATRSGLPDLNGAVNNMPLPKEADDNRPLSNTDTVTIGVASNTGTAIIDIPTETGIRPMAYTDKPGQPPF